MDTVKKDIPAHVLLFCYQRFGLLYHFLSGWKEKGGRMETLLINAEHKEEATQRETSSETKLFGFSFAKW